MYAYLCIFLYFCEFYKYFALGRRPQGLFFLENDGIYVYICICMYFVYMFMHFTSISLQVGACSGFFF